ncbi:three-Cys-motif partner protein TcmP [Candidatus Poribacteria bacterium]|nr:three-Cys-motif partner protein TcmP [Candidatus Poribacteria bacterium]
MPEDINKKPFDEATITKLEIFERYLEAWLPVFINAPFSGSLLVCDFFAGSGYDAEGTPGSPMRILKTVEKFREGIIKKAMRIRVVLNERNIGKATILESRMLSEIEQIRRQFGDLISLDCCNEDFGEFFNARYADFGAQPNLMFIDQYGIKEVNDAIFRRLIALEKTDFLFFISSSILRRFPEEESVRTYFPDLNANAIRNAGHENAHRAILDYYRRKIPAGNSMKLYPFSIRKAANIYGLIFGSKHPLGVEKFLNIAWDKNRLNGEANFDIDDDMEKRQGSLFPELQRLTKLELFERELGEYIRESGEVTNRDVYDFTLAHGHAPRHGRDVMMKLRKEGKIDCDAQIGCSYKSCHKDRSIRTIKAVKNG